MDLKSLGDELERAAVVAQIQNFGQTPRRLFRRDHPVRGLVSVASPSAWLRGGPSLTSFTLTHLACLADASAHHGRASSLTAGSAAATALLAQIRENDDAAGNDGGFGSGGCVADVMCVKDEGSSLFGTALSFVCAGHQSLLLPAIKAKLSFGSLDCGLFLEPFASASLRFMARDRIASRGGNSSGSSSSGSSSGGGSSGSSSGSGGGILQRRIRLARLHSQPITCVAVAADSSLIGMCAHFYQHTKNN